jgi:hypothetical protein
MIILDSSSNMLIISTRSMAAVPLICSSSTGGFFALLRESELWLRRSGVTPDKEMGSQDDI